MQDSHLTPPNQVAYDSFNASYLLGESFSEIEVFGRYSTSFKVLMYNTSLTAFVEDGAVKLRPWDINVDKNHSVEKNLENVKEELSNLKEEDYA